MLQAVSAMEGVNAQDPEKAAPPAPPQNPTGYLHHGHVAAINDDMTEVWLAGHISKAQGERVL